MNTTNSLKNDDRRDALEHDYTLRQPTTIPHLRVQTVHENGLSEESRIAAGDIVILDIERAPQDGDAVCVTLPARGGVTLFRRYRREGEHTILRPDRGEPVVVAPDEPLILEGVVQLSIRLAPRPAESGA